MSLGSTVFLNEKQRARAENVTFQWGSRRWQKFSGSYEVLQHRGGLQCHILGYQKSPWSDSEHPVSAEKLPDQTAVSKWCWWELWWFSFPWCLLRDCTAQIMVPSITWAALGYKRQEANKIYRRSMPFWRGTWKSSGIIQCTRNGNRQHRAVLLRTNN